MKNKIKTTPLNKFEDDETYVGMRKAMMAKSAHRSFTTGTLEFVAIIGWCLFLMMLVDKLHQLKVF